MTGVQTCALPICLAIDEDRQPELTAERVEKWVKQISEELHLDEIINA